LTFQIHLGILCKGLANAKQKDSAAFVAEFLLAKLGHLHTETALNPIFSNSISFS